MDNVWTTVDKHCQPGSRKQKIGMRYLWVHHHNHNQPTQDIPPPTKHTPHIHQLLATSQLPTHTPTSHPSSQPRQPSQQAKPSQPTRTPSTASQQARPTNKPGANRSRSNQLVINQILDNHLLHNVARLARYIPGLFALLR